MGTGQKSVLTVFLMFAMAGLFCACSFAPAEGAAAGEPADHPDFILRNADYLMGIAGGDPILVKARTIRIYQTAGKAYLDGIDFIQKDALDNPVFTGKADSAIIDTGSNDAVISGNVQIINHRDNMAITAEALNWYNSPQILESGADQIVSIEYDEGNLVKGLGFTGDFTHALYEFQSVGEGLLRYE